MDEAATTSGRPLRFLRVVAVALPVLSLVLIASALIILAILVANGWLKLEAAGDIETTIAVVALAVGFTLLGWLMVHRLPSNRLGWVYVSIGSWQALNMFAGNYSSLAYWSSRGQVPFAATLSWVGLWAWVPGFTLFSTLGIVLFPSGTFPSARWRFIAVLAGAALLLLLVPQAVASWPYRGLPLEEAAANVAQPPADPALDAALALAAIGQVVLLVAMICSVIGLGVRFRASSGVERQQIKWFWVAAALDVAILILWILVDLDPVLAAVTAIVFGAALPTAIAVAILRYRLYEIDVLIRGTAVYVPLTAILAGIYAATIALFQRLFVAITGNPSDAAVILSTLILATTFTPLKNSIQAAVDRRFGGASSTDRRLRTFADTVSHQVARAEPALVMREFLRVAAEAVTASGGAAYIRNGAEDALVGETSSRSRRIPTDIAVHADGHHVGHITLDGRRDGRPYSQGDLMALQQTADRIAVVCLDGAAGQQPIELR